MATLVLSAVLSSVGAAVGGPFGAQVGMALGSYVGGQIDQAVFGEDQRVEGPRRQDLRITASTYGKTIPVIFAGRAAGNIIWGLPVDERRVTKSSGGGKGGGPDVEQVEYHYYATFAVSVGEGPVAMVSRVWANGRLIVDPFVEAETPDMTVYLGDETQEPDAEIEAQEGTGNVPGYRWQAYVLFKEMHLNPFGGSIPNLEFEVVGKLTAGWGEELAQDVLATGGKVYLLNRLQRTMTVLDETTLVPRDTIGRDDPDAYLGTLRAQPWRLCLEPTSGHLFVVSMCDAMVQRIDPASGQVVADIDVGIYPCDIVADGAGAVWVTHPWLDELTRIEVADNSVTTVAMSGEPYTIAAKTDGTLAIGCTAKVVHFDPATQAVLGEADLSAVGKWFPGGITHNTSPLDGKLWFACSGNDVVGIVNDDYSLSWRNSGTWPLDASSHPDDPNHTVYVSLIFGNRVKLLRRASDYGLDEFLEVKTEVWPGHLRASPSGCLVVNHNRPFYQEIEVPQ